MKITNEMSARIPFILAQVPALETFFKKLPNLKDVANLDAELYDDRNDVALIRVCFVDGSSTTMGLYRNDFFYTKQTMNEAWKYFLTGGFK